MERGANPPGEKRVFLFAGHYGSGKTNLAVNWALHLRDAGKEVLLADLDIVNPYFRAKDSQRVLAARGVELIASPYANSNVDVPALPQEAYAICDRRDKCAVVDVGGDERGATALGRYAPGILEENRYEMWFIFNAFRPLTRDTEGALRVLNEIEAMSGMRFTGVVNNSNLGAETAPEDVLRGQALARGVAEAAALPLVMTSARACLVPALRGEIQNLFPLRLTQRQDLPDWEEENG